MLGIQIAEHRLKRESFGLCFVPLQLLQKKLPSFGVWATWQMVMIEWSYVIQMIKGLENQVN